MGLKGVKGGRAGPPRYGIQIPNVNRDDTRILALADFLRNEKRSGLHTKEAVQYEKVRARRTSRTRRAAPPAFSRPTDLSPPFAACGVL